MGAIKVKLAKSKADKEKIFKFRYNVIESTGTYQPAIDYDEKKIEEPIDHKAWLMSSEEDGEITGTFRTYTLDQESFEYAKQCEIENWLRILEPDEVSCTSKFMIYQSSRKNRTILTLLKKHYQFLVENSIKVDLICCPEPTLPYYEWVGYRKFAKPFHHSTSPWALIPMALITQDTDYLKKIRSPLYDPNIEIFEDTTLSLFLERTFPDKYTTSSAYIQLRRIGNKYNIVFKNDVMKPYITALKHHKYINGEDVYVAGDEGSSLHLIVAGSAKTEKQTFKAGDLFGEASMLHPGKREETIVAQGHLETLELESEDFYNIVNEKPETAPLILQLIGEKLREMNIELAQ